MNASQLFILSKNSVNKDDLKRELDKILERAERAAKDGHTRMFWNSLPLIPKTGLEVALHSELKTLGFTLETQPSIRFNRDWVYISWLNG